jgi:hypothetical protein
MEKSMKCEVCSAALDPETLRCPVCGARHTRVCVGCGRVPEPGEAVCRECGEALVPGLDMTREEMSAAGQKCFMPYSGDRVYKIYLGGNRDGGGHVFHNLPGYTHTPPERRVVLPSLVEGHPIYGIWNEYFCVGDEFIEDSQGTYARMMPIREIVVSRGIQECFTYAFFGCAGLEVLDLPRSLKRMMNDFYDLFMDGKEAMGNGVKKRPITIRYHGTEEDWKKVAVTSRLWDYVYKGCIRMEYLGRDEG